MRMRSLLSLIFLFFLAGIGRADAQPRPSWDNRGWVPLGERTVNGRIDRDRIVVGPYEGKFAKLTLAVEDNDLEMLDFRIVFADRTELHPVVNHIFREGERTQVIRLPFGERVIREIDFKYRNIGPGGNARVQVWGFRVGQQEPPVVYAPPPPPVTVVSAPPPPPRHSWDTNGWTLLGQRQVNGRVDRDRIEVGRYEGRFRKLMMAVEDSDLELLDFRIVFDDRTEFRPQLSFFFREGQRSRSIDLPYSERTIRFIDIKYRNTRGGGPASVEVWGQRELPPPPPPPPAPPVEAPWDQRGWTLLGEKRVDSHREDADRIEVSRWEPRFHKLSLVVLDADMELIDLTIKFKHAEPFHPDVRQFFRAGSRARLIELPGYEERTIRWIEFRYRNLPGEGRARVQVWAR